MYTKLSGILAKLVARGGFSPLLLRSELTGKLKLEASWLLDYILYLVFFFTRPGIRYSEQYVIVCVCVVAVGR